MSGMAKRHAAVLLASLVLALALAMALPVPCALAGEIVISLAERRLYLLDEGTEARSYPVAIGRPGVEIPLGDTIVVRKRRNPTWHPTPAQRRAKPSLPAMVPPGPSNPLGKFALDLGWTTYAIHGTNEPDSIGRRASSGCFRMKPEDIEAVFGTVEVGTPVRVIEAAFRGQTPVPAPAPAPARMPQPEPPRPVVAQAAPAPPAPPPPPDPRCATATAPLKRLTCADPELALLEGRARVRARDFLDGLPATARTQAAFALVQDERRFDDRLTTRCWVRAGTETDPAVAAPARACLKEALTARLSEVETRIAELSQSKPPPARSLPVAQR